jgi:hypothetical protein
MRTRPAHRPPLTAAPPPEWGRHLLEWPAAVEVTRAAAAAWAAWGAGAVALPFLLTEAPPHPGAVLGTLLNAVGLGVSCVCLLRQRRRDRARGGRS